MNPIRVIRTGAGFTFGNALHYNGSNNEVTTTDTTFSNGYVTMTLSYWLNTDNWADTTSIPICRATGGALDWSIRNNLGGSNTIRYSIDSAGWSFQTGALTINNGQWYHVGIMLNLAGATNPLSGKIYIDGIDRTNPAGYGGSKPATLATSTKKLNFGGVTFSPTYAYDGLLDEINIWTNADINNALHAWNNGNGAEPDSANLIRSYKFNEIDPSTTAIDSAGNDNGTLVNFTFGAGSKRDPH